MKFGQPRLLPIVIAATAALLLFKGIGIVTQGGYSLVGSAPTVAQEHAAAAPAGGAGDTSVGGTDMIDQSPTIEDKAVTMDLPSGESAGPAEGGHGATAPEVGPADAGVPTEACPPTGSAQAGDAAAPADPSATPAEAAPGAAAPADAAAASGPCVPDPGVNQYGDALPLIKDNATGNLVPLADTITDVSSEAAINQRLSQRRSELDTREKELEMRSTLLDAAEKRIEERSAELKAMEERISKLVDDNKTAEQQQFVSLVAMYENMKPKDAATIFDQLDMPVLLGVAKAMNPRKMAPILAKMDPQKAKALTDGIAAADAPASAAADATTQSAPDLTNLPQIVGQ